MNKVIKKTTLSILYSLVVMTSITQCMERDVEKTENLEKNESILECLTEECPVCFETFGSKHIPLQFHCSYTKEGYPVAHGLCVNCTKHVIQNGALCPLCRSTLLLFDPLAASENIHPKGSVEMYNEPEIIDSLIEIMIKIPTSPFINVKQSKDSSSVGYWKVVDLIMSSENFFPEVTSVKFSPDGKRVLTGSNTVACLWDAQTGSLLKKFVR
ncbi:hypothetical protein H0X06_00830 [Candidatus Dependentiae bacterium]|nr:hypothetical protein [Candidatus Dependentiae bacterium]